MPLNKGYLGLWKLYSLATFQTKTISSWSQRKLTIKSFPLYFYNRLIIVDIRLVDYLDKYLEMGFLKVFKFNPRRFLVVFKSLRISSGRDNKTSQKNFRLIENIRYVFWGFWRLLVARPGCELYYHYNKG